MRQYLDLMQDVVDNGVLKPNRTGVDSYAVFGRSMRFDMAEGYPLVTTKWVNFKAVRAEMLWMINGRDDLAWLHERGVHIWDPWANEDGDLGPVYGVQWRSWRDDCGRGSIDQLQIIIDALRDPQGRDSRRLVCTAWQPAELDIMALPPCHYSWQVVHNAGRLDMMVVMRSVDVFIGLPFNIAGYALLLHWLAKHVGLEPGVLYWSAADVHIYVNQMDAVVEQLHRRPHELPTLEVVSREQIKDYVVEDFTLNDYVHAPAIKAPVAV